MSLAAPAVTKQYCTIVRIRYSALIYNLAVLAVFETPIVVSLECVVSLTGTSDCVKGAGAGFTRSMITSFRVAMRDCPH